MIIKFRTTVEGINFFKSKIFQIFQCRIYLEMVRKPLEVGNRQLGLKKDPISLIFKFLKNFKSAIGKSAIVV